jgi:hypothetical protein
MARQFMSCTAFVILGSKKSLPVLPKSPPNRTADLDVLPPGLAGKPAAAIVTLSDAAKGDRAVSLAFLGRQCPVNTP